jgi:hypothetical protein
MKLLQLNYHWMKVRGNVCNEKALTEIELPAIWYYRIIKQLIKI